MGSEPPESSKTNQANQPKSKKPIEIDLEFEGLNKANDPIQISGANKSLILLDSDGDDRNARFHIQSSSPGLDVKFSNDGKKLVIRGGSNGDITLKLSWDDNPDTAGVAVKSIKLLGETWRQEGREGEVTKTIKFSFDENNQDRQTTSEESKDPVSDKSEVGKSQYKIVKVERGVEVEGQVRNIFDTIKYIDKANRKLWRITPSAGKKDAFLNSYGIVPFAPKPKLKSKSVPSSSELGTGEIAY